MSQATMNPIDQQVSDIVSEVNIDDWTCQYWAQGEFLALERLLPRSLSGHSWRGALAIWLNRLIQPLC